MTRRDRAAMVLALCELRGSVVCYDSALEALKHHDGGDWPPYLVPVLVDAEAEMDDAIDAPVGSVTWYAAHYRNRDMLRARLALLLRAVLRADARDFGPCPADCWGCLWGHVSGSFQHERPRRITPLWEIAGKRAMVGR